MEEQSPQPFETLPTTDDTGLLPHLLALNDDEVILPLKLKREDVHKMRAIKLREDEIEAVDDFQDYLYKRRIIYENTWPAFVVYCINLAFTKHNEAVDNEVRLENKK